MKVKFLKSRWKKKKAKTTKNRPKPKPVNEKPIGRMVKKEVCQRGTWQLLDWADRGHRRAWGRDLCGPGRRQWASQGAGQEARPWTQLRKGGGHWEREADTEKEHGARGGGGAGVRRSPLGPRSRMGTLTFHEAVLQPQTEYHSFPQIHYLFPLMGILALSFLTLWWINFVLMFINALLTLPGVKFWLVTRFSVSAVVRHCSGEPNLRKMKFIPLGSCSYLTKNLKLCFAT